MAADQLKPNPATGVQAARSGTPVFLYHGLTRDGRAPGSPRERKYWVSAKRFREHLDVILEQDRAVSDLAEFWMRSPNRPSAVLTFDDGLQSDYAIAFPQLLETGLQATFFLNSTTVGESGYLSWDQVREMHRHGMSFHSHSHDHVYLTRLRWPELLRQVRFSKEKIEDETGARVDFLAAPYGDLNDEVLAAALDTGYRALCSSRSRAALTGSLLVDRVAVYGHTNGRQFRSLLRAEPLHYRLRAIRQALIFLPRQVLVRARAQKTIPRIEMKRPT
ncbi:MAG TPA: polysaccharide deacetylase family protein [Bryobacteraceae bacterium]|nr:polysaccharide deacetylase family protein [Bryobacteraceae bacterium]